jgi:5-enolpyruvylshikimate-3-phosphate synthase
MRQFLEMIDAFGISCVHSQDNRVIVPALQFFRSTSIAVPLDSRAVGWLSMVAAATASRIVFDCPNSDTGSLLTSPVIDVLKQLGHAVQFSSNSITIAPEKPGQAHDSVIMRADEPEIDLLSTVACIHAAGKPGRIENLSKLPPDVHGSLEDLVDALNNAGGNLTCDRQSLIIPADKPTHAANLDARNNADLSAPLALVGLCHRHASIVRCPPMPQWLRSAIRMITNL